MDPQKVRPMLWPLEQKSPKTIILRGIIVAKKYFIHMFFNIKQSKSDNYYSALECFLEAIYISDPVKIVLHWDLIREAVVSKLVSFYTITILICNWLSDEGGL